MNFGTIVGISFLLLLMVVYGIICGSSVEEIMSSKGYYGKKYFWLGFFGGYLAYRDALLQSQADHGDIPYDDNDVSSTLLKGDIVDLEKEPDAWQCRRCCKWNHRYMANCSCGNSKTANMKMIQKSAELVQELAKKK